MKRTLVFLLAACSMMGAKAQDSIPSFIKDSLDKYVATSLHNWQIPGIAVCVVKDGKVVLMKGYGVKEVGGKDSIDVNTLFMIGSNTKAFTGTALAILEAEQQLSLQDKVKKWLPDFTMYDPWVAKEATIGDLLCHRLGFETFQGDFMYFDSDLTLQQVREKMGKLKPMYSFRSKWGYTNSAFMTAGEIVPKVTGKSWAAFLQEKIFDRLQMNRTLALSKDIKTATNKASAHTVVAGELRKVAYGKIDNLAPAGSISSSVNDMSHWLLMQLNQGMYNGEQVVAESALLQTWVPWSIIGNGGHQYNKAHFALYGLGWMLEEYSGRKIVSHTGGVNGFVTSVTLVPEEKLGILVFTNTDANSLYEALRQEILDAWLGLPYRNYSQVYYNYYQENEKERATLLQTKRDTIAMKPATALPLQAYSGNYVHDVYGNMNIRLENGALIMRFEHHKGLSGKLEALGGNRFFCTYNEPLYGMKELPFTVANGKVRSLTVRVADFVEFTPYEFIKK